MRLFDFINHIKGQQQLDENAQARYAEMAKPLERMMIPKTGNKRTDAFADMINMDIEEQIKYFYERIKWSRRTFHTPQQITWFLKLLRSGFAEEIAEHAVGSRKIAGDPVAGKPMPPEILAAMDVTINNLLAVRDAIINTTRMEEPEHSINVGRINLRSYAAKFEHYFSQGIPDVDRYNPTGKGLTQVFADLDRIEKAYRSKFGNTLQMGHEDDGATLVMKFPNGSAWFNLNKSVCSAEANAMGHCGNSGSAQSYETILSYRTPVRGNLWAPHLTFILDKRTGMLGEMKGRNNDKPVAKYHPYIVALLKQPIIKGIVGGGYMPEHNFSMADLPVEQAAELIKEKPLLADALTIYRVNGNKVNAAVMKKLKSMFEGSSMAPPTYDKKLNAFVIASYKSFDDAVEEVFGDDSTIYKILKMESDYFDDDSYYENVDDGSIQTTFEDLPEYLKKAVYKYTKETYPDQIEEDMDDRDVIRLLDEESDELISTLRNAIADGLRYGAEAEAHRAAMAHIKDFGTGNKFSIIHTRNLDAPAYLICDDIEYVLTNIDNVVEYGDPIAGYNIDPDDLEPPHYGWTEYDEKHAVERGIEGVSEIVDSYIPVKIKKQVEAKRKADYEKWRKQHEIEQKKLKAEEEARAKKK